MRQIAEWLEAIGLAKYQSVFADDETDWSLLPKLTEADLKELGLPLGPRKKLLEAIANLDAASVTASMGKLMRPSVASLRRLINFTVARISLDDKKARERHNAFHSLP